MLIKKLRFLFLLAIASTFFAVNSMVVFAIEYGGIGGRPAYPREDNSRTESIFIHTLEPGQKQEEGVLLVNNSSERKTLQVYAVDSVVSSGGSFACRQMVESKTDVGEWIELADSEVSLNPGANEIVDFNINVPKNASVGEHNGCIVIQEKKDSDQDQAGVNLSFRTGLRVAITIPGEIVKKLEISSLDVERQSDGSINIKPAVKNLVNVSIDADIKVVTKNLFGFKHAEQGGVFPVLRGEVAEWNFEVKKPFWGGVYHSELTVDYQDDQKAEIGQNVSEQQKISLSQKSANFIVLPTIPALIIEVLIVVLLGLLLLVVYKNKKRNQLIETTCSEIQVKSGDDLKTIADKYGVSWKLLAKVNKIKAPYTLRSGQKLKTPSSK